MSEMAKLETRLKSVQSEMLELLDKRGDLSNYRVRFYSLKHEYKKLQERYIKCTGREWTPSVQGDKAYGRAE